MSNFRESKLFKNFAHREFELLVCVYTCRKQADLLSKFYSTEFGDYLKGLSNTLILEIYADPEIPESVHDNNELILKTEERYENLSVKSYLMIDYCVSNFQFKHLLKVDVTIVVPRLNLEPESSHAQINPRQMVKFLSRRGSFGDYAGIKLLTNAGRKGAENWANKKGGSIDYQQVFGEQNMPHYYTGKCYALSNRLARYISQHGSSMAREHAHYLMGSEDVMIGRLNERFKKGYVA